MRRRSAFLLLVIVVAAVLAASVYRMRVLERYSTEILQARSQPRGNALFSQLLDAPLPREPAEYAPFLQAFDELNRKTESGRLRDFLGHVILAQLLGEIPPQLPTVASAIRWQQENGATIDALRQRAMQDVLQVRLDAADPRDERSFAVEVVNTARAPVGKDFEISVRIDGADDVKDHPWRDIRCRRSAGPQGWLRPGGGAAAVCPVRLQSGSGTTAAQLQSVVQRLGSGELLLVTSATILPLRSGPFELRLLRSVRSTSPVESILVQPTSGAETPPPTWRERVGCEQMGTCEIERKERAVDRKIYVAIVSVGTAAMLAALLATGIVYLLLARGRVRNVAIGCLAVLPVLVVPLVMGQGVRDYFSLLASAVFSQAAVFPFWVGLVAGCLLLAERAGPQSPRQRSSRVGGPAQPPPTSIERPANPANAATDRDLQAHGREATGPGSIAYAAGGKTCLKCGHERAAGDPGPDYACPACGAVYAKVAAALEARRAADAAKPARLDAQRASVGDAEDRARDDRLRVRATIVYILGSPSVLTALILLPVASMLKRSASDSYVLSHFDWQIATLRRTVALTFLVAVYVGLGLLVALKYSPREWRGFAGLVVVWYSSYGLMLLVQAWFWYRFIRGWYRLWHRQYAP